MEFFGLGERELVVVVVVITGVKSLFISVNVWIRHGGKDNPQLCLKTESLNRLC